MIIPYTDEYEAHASAARRSRGRAMYVVVDGPQDGEHTVIDIQDAIDGGFYYSWRWPQ